MSCLGDMKERIVYLTCKHAKYDLTDLKRLDEEEPCGGCCLLEERGEGGGGRRGMIKYPCWEQE